MKCRLQLVLGVVVAFAAFSHLALAQTTGTSPLAAADAYVNAPHNWQMWFPVAGSPMMVKIDWLMKYVLWIMFGVVAFVGILMGYVMWRFSARRNPVPGTVTHNTLIEVVWIVVPTLILAIIIIPSINLIYYEADDSNSYMTVTVTGHQWYWEYSYNAVPGLDYTSYMIPDDKLQPGQIRRLSVDHPLVLPIGKKIKFDITSGDVLHGFYLPSLGVQRYAIPGTVVHSWTLIPKAGTYYGQCNQICGLGHDAMPIEIKAVPMADYLAWVKQAQANYTENTVPTQTLNPAPAATLLADSALH
ncbi:MAG: cytochrome c oxidase subunit II [Acidocella sp.]|nr:cytochrome c oxidase subunit II [Acidocella sp.]